MRMNLAVAGIDHQPFVVRFINQELQQRFPEAFVAPAAEAPMRILPIAIIGGQIAPGGTCTQDPEHRIDEGAIVFGYASPLSCLARQVGLEQCPVLV